MKFGSAYEGTVRGANLKAFKIQTHSRIASEVALDIKMIIYNHWYGVTSIQRGLQALPIDGRLLFLVAWGRSSDLGDPLFLPIHAQQVA